MDILTYILAKKYADKIAETFAGGLKYKGSKATVEELHAITDKKKGDMWTVLSNGHEYVWDDAQWVDLGADLNNKADKTELTAETNARTIADNTLQNNINVKQDRLTAGTNITIENNVISATGGGTNVEANVEITGDEDELLSLKVGDKVYQNLNYHPFPDSFVTNKTLKEFGQSIVNYTGFATGCTWFGGIQCTDLPGNMMQVECKVTAIRDKISWARNIAVVEIYSSEVAPFYWHYNTDSWGEGTGLNDWKYVASIDGSKLSSTAAIGDNYLVKVKKVSAAAGSTGWEFYAEEGGGGEPTEYLSSALVDENNNLKINNKNGQEVVNCSVNYILDNAKVKAVLTDAEKETLLSGVTGTTWIAAQSNISALQTGKQDKLTSDNAGNSISIVEPSGEHNLPKAYQEVEYIEKPKTAGSDNTLMIDLGLTGGLTQYGVDFKFSAGTYENNHYFILSNANQWDLSGIQLSSNDTSKVIFIYGKSYHTFDSINIGSVNTVLTVSNKNGTITVNGTNCGSFNTSTAQKVAGPLTLWGTGTTTGSVIRNGYGKCYYLKVYSDIACTTLVRDLIPCYRKSDNKVGLYDLVNNVFYTNTGSGAFIAGTKVITETTINVSAPVVELTGESGTLTAAQVSVLANSVLAYITLGGKHYKLSSITFRSGVISIYSCSLDGTDDTIEVSGTSWTHRKTELQPKLTAGDNITIDTNNKISSNELPEYPTDTNCKYTLALKYEDGAWVKYWKEIANKSDLVDRGTVDYMVLKS